METKDLYKVLGVSRGASQEEIRRSYRKLAREHHPDANRDDKDAEERFKEIQHAYEILSNPEKRRQYDEGPRAFFGGGNAGQGGAGGARTADFSDLSDLFGGLGDIFGASTRTRETSRKGQNITATVNLSFNDALNGVTTRVNVPVEEACGECRGEGRSGGRPVRGDAGSRASGLQAARGRLCSRGAGQLRGSGARGADRGAAAGWWDGQAEVAGWDAGRQAVQGAGSGGA